MDVLVTGGEEKQGLTITRSLGKKGIRVLLGGSEEQSIGFYSKYVTDTFVYPSPYDDIEGFVHSVINKTREYDIPIIFPAIESTLVCLDRYRSFVEKTATLAAPPSELLQLAIDKIKTVELAKQLDIPVPETVVVLSLEHAIESASKLGYPIAMKPRGSRFHAKLPGKLTFKVAYASSKQELTQKLTHLCSEGVYPLLQEFCSGKGICVAAVASQGRPLVLFQYCRAREVPLTGGVSVVRESMKLDPRLKDYCEKLLKAMNWTGPAMVEFKYNPEKDKFILMEVNSRVQSSIALAYYSGVDVPYMVYELFSHGREISIDSYRIGVRCRWLRGDIDTLKRHLSNETLQQYIKGDAGGLNKNPGITLPSKSRSIFDFIKDFRPGVRYDIESMTDPMPGWVELKKIIKGQAGTILYQLRKPRLSKRKTLHG